MKLHTHNTVVNAVTTSLQHAGLQASIKAVGFDPQGSRMAPDILVHTREGIKLIDVTIYNPLSALRMEPEIEVKNCQSSEEALAGAEQRKLTKYRGLETDHTKVVPFALTFHGGVGKLASNVMSLAWAEDQLNEKQVKALSDQFRRAVACAIVRGNADAFRKFNEPVRQRQLAREGARAEAHIGQWLNERREAAAAAERKHP